MKGTSCWRPLPNALIIGFNVRPDKGAIDSAERQGVEIRTYRIIYECIEEIEAAMKGMLAPSFREEVLAMPRSDKPFACPLSVQSPVLMCRTARLPGTP